MRMRILVLAALSLTLVAAVPKAFGGWGVVTLQEVPEYLEVGRPVTIAFRLRGHGRWLMEDVSPRVDFRADHSSLLLRALKRDRVRAEAAGEPGLYRATYTPSDTGRITIVVHTGLARWQTPLLPIPVVPQGTRRAPQPPVDRGRHLFAAKGCATCHAKTDDPVFAEWPKVRVGPDLMDRTFPATWLVQKLTDPGSLRPGTTPESMETVMPDLALAPAEVNALVAYLNHDPTATDHTDRP